MNVITNSLLQGAKNKKTTQEKGQILSESIEKDLHSFEKIIWRTEIDFYQNEGKRATSQEMKQSI